MVLDLLLFFLDLFLRNRCLFVLLLPLCLLCCVLSWTVILFLVCRCWKPSCSPQTASLLCWPLLSLSPSCHMFAMLISQLRPSELQTHSQPPARHLHVCVQRYCEPDMSGTELLMPGLYFISLNGNQDFQVLRPDTLEFPLMLLFPTNFVLKHSLRHLTVPTLSFSAQSPA